MEKLLLYSSLVIFVPFCGSLNHGLSLMWSQKHVSGAVRIAGIEGDPEDWIGDDKPIATGQASPSDTTALYQSTRISLTYRYQTRNICWNDKTFRDITCTQLQEVATRPYVYNASHFTIYSGASSEVNGLAMDWLSGSIYWTDSQYHWIAAAAADKYDVYRIMVSGLDRPMGIVVYPQRGKMYWSNQGSTPKIEEASLDGSNRRVLTDTDIGDPVGVAIDYQEDMLYFVDDWTDTIHRIDLITGNRFHFKVEALMPKTGQHGGLYGIAVWHEYIFVTDQFYNSMRVYDKSTYKSKTSLLLGSHSMPYDVMMYASDGQEAMYSDCRILNCEHMCVSTGRGKGECLCAYAHILNTDGKTCKPDNKMTQPIFIYTIGHSLCGSRISISDRGQVHPKGDVECFYSGVAEAKALAFYSNGEYIFFSDVQNHTISRFRPIDEFKRQEVAANVGIVKGMVVDWLSENLYWTDETKGTISVSRLDGRHPQVVARDLGWPRGIAVDPHLGIMYYAEGRTNKINKLNMDGSNHVIFVHDITEPEGITLDKKRKRLYWAEAAGIYSVQFDGLDKKLIYTHADKQSKFKSVTVFQDYYAYTNGESMLYYGQLSDGSTTDPRPIQHIDSTVSHDIIAYADYLQPPDECSSGVSGCRPKECRVDNGGCDHLCLPTSSISRVCKCAFGFQLSQSDEKSCLSNIVDKNFLLFVDPFHRQIYQMDLEYEYPEIQGLPITTPQFPTIIDLDIVKRDVIWLDQGANVLLKAPLVITESESEKDGANDVKNDKKKRKRRSLGLEKQNVLFVVNEFTSIVYFVVSSRSREFIYSDAKDNALYRVGLENNKKSTFSSNSPAKLMAINEDSGMLYWVEDNGAGSRVFSKNIYKSNKREVLKDDSRITGIAVDIEGKMLYWCSQSSIKRSDLNGKGESVFLSNQNGDLHNVAITKTHVYYTFYNRKSMYRIDKAGNMTTQEEVTDQIFSRITSLKDFSWVEERDKYKDYGDEPEGPIRIGTLIGIIAGVVGLLLLVLFLALCLLKGRWQKKLPKSDFEVEAHDNPTYMTTTDITSVGQTRDPTYYTLSGGAFRPASAGSRDSDLPDVVKLPLPDDDMAAPGGESPNVANENVVRPSQVVMKVGAERTLSVKYKSGS